MQPQAHVQTLRRMLDEGYDPQAALDAPRLRIEPDGEIGLEATLQDIGRTLVRRGYRVVPLATHRAGTGQFVGMEKEGWWEPPMADTTDWPKPSPLETTP